MNYFSNFQASDRKTSFQHHFHIIQRVQNQFSKHEMELSKQEMKLFLLFPDLGSKNFFLTKYLPFLIRSPNPVLQTGNGIIQTGNGIICPFSGL